jgi:hypothetical protein
LNFVSDKLIIFLSVAGKLGRYAEEQLIEARRIGDKASFLKAMDSITRE